MLHSTELLGGEAYDKDGHFVGHVTELFIEPADQPNRVARILLGRGKFLPLVARYDHLAFRRPWRPKTERRRKGIGALPARMRAGLLFAKTCSTSKSSTPAVEKSFV